MVNNTVLAYVNPLTGKTNAISVITTELYHGAQIASSQASNHKYRTAYFGNYYFDNFRVVVQTFPYARYKALGDWLQGYSYIATNSGINEPTVMTVYVNRNVKGLDNFVGVGVLDDGVSAGDKVGEIVYTMSLDFVGAANQLDPLSAQFSDITDLHNVGPNDNVSFYPSGSQSNNAAQPLEEVLYGSSVLGASAVFAPSSVF